MYKTYILCHISKEQIQRYVTLVNQVNHFEMKNVEYFSHTWKDDITKKIREQYCKSDTCMFKKDRRNMRERPLDDAEISVFLNYISLLRKIKKENTSGLFITIESDAILMKDYKERIDTVISQLSELKNWDVINIGEGTRRGLRYHDKYPKSKPIIIGKNEFYNEDIHAAIEGLIWNYKGICKFLHHFDLTQDVDGPIDTKMDWLSINGGFDIYWLEPAIMVNGTVFNKYITDIPKSCMKNVQENNEKLYPITFSISETKIMKRSNAKTKILSSLIPGDLRTYIYNTEIEYYNEYKSSIFALTKKKAGWDCLRHYEIIANGCIPIFLEIEKCPSKCIHMLPKQLLIEAHYLYRCLKDKQISLLTKEEHNRCEYLQNKFTEYLRMNLTTKCIASYIFKKTGHTNVNKILYLSGSVYPDYLRCLTLTGMKELLGKEAYDYPRINHLYSDYKDTHKLYGKGMSYANILDPSLHQEKTEETIKNEIIEHKYDVIIYGSMHRGLPLYEFVNSHYKPDEVIFLDGEDEHNCTMRKEHLDRGHHVFVRELI